MKDSKDFSFLNNNFELYKKIINNSYYNNFEKLITFKNLIINSNKKNKIFCAANGGSNTIITHFSVDMLKLNKLHVSAFNDPALITAFTNDYSQELSTKKMVEYFCKKNDLLIIISSSGESLNLINAARFAKKKNIKLVTFTGFKKNNTLSKISPFNIWVDSKSYNMVENIHQIMLTSVIDLIYGDIYYPSNL